MSTVADSSLPSIDAEEQARADLYALLSRLFAAPPDSELLRGIASSSNAASSSAGETTGEFVQSWADLVSTAGKANVAVIADEYHELFVGSGRAEISLYIGAHTARSSVDTPLVALRDYLASHGLQRQTGVHEPEDHIAMLFEIMRYLISEARSSVDQQKSFFEKFLWSGGVLLCDAITAHPRTHFYRPVADLTKKFLFVEHDAFDM